MNAALLFLQHLNQFLGKLGLFLVRQWNIPVVDTPDAGPDPNERAKRKNLKELADAPHRRQALLDLTGAQWTPGRFHYRSDGLLNINACPVVGIPSGLDPRHFSKGAE